MTGDVQLCTLCPTVGGIQTDCVVSIGHAKRGTHGQVWNYSMEERTRLDEEKEISETKERRVREEVINHYRVCNISKNYHN